jgi:cell division septation protein DedD
LKNKDNAQRLAEQLKAKGYPSRLETHEGKWSRVLVGSFDDREKAMKYVTDFNQKEHMEALVIREP